MTKELETDLLSPKESYSRTQALRRLKSLLEKNPDYELTEKSKKFLSSFQTDDKVQSVLTGIILYFLNNRVANISVLARTFFGIDMDWEPELQKFSLVLFEGSSKREVFEDLTEMVGLDLGSEEDKFYAYNVISSVNYDAIED